MSIVRTKEIRMFTDSGVEVRYARSHLEEETQSILYLNCFNFFDEFKLGEIINIEKNKKIVWSGHIKNIKCNFDPQEIVNCEIIAEKFKKLGE